MMPAYRVLCRFMDFQKRCMTEKYDFQITNHNYVLADLIGRKQGKKPLFPSYGAMVLDEAHKLLDAARQMYSTVWGELDAELIASLSIIKGKPAGIDELAVLQGRVMEYNRQIFDRLSGELSGSHTREGSRAEIVVGPVERSYMKQMAAALGRLPLSYQESGGQRMRMQTLKRYCRELADKLGVFSDSGHFICWMEKGENCMLALCAVPMELEQILFQDIWSRPIPAIITSGTMSVRGDFTHFKKMTGIQLAAPARVMEYQRTLILTAGILSFRKC